MDRAILQLVRSALCTALTGIDALLEAPLGDELSLAPGRRCPKCQNGEPEKIEDTGVLDAPRLTCLKCGVSWSPGKVVERG